MKSVRWKSLGLVAGAILPYAYLVASPAPVPPKVSFGRDIAPIFKAHCISCHSGASPSAKLDLTGRAGIAKGGFGGSLFSTDASHSVLMERIDGRQGPQMPMGMPALSGEELSKVRQWISQGMNFDAESAPKHWAYVAPMPPKIPTLNSTWVQNPIDAFVLQKLRDNHLSPSPPASKETLIRRVTLDLTGLLPTPSEVKAFVTDSSPQAYEKVVDRLLASPHYGERQAREWLDLARYADSDGYEKDLNRDAWLYRDWVINAFNRNEPYDQFTIDQIAGDLLPNATAENKIATGFQRNTMFNREGGVDQEEAHFMVELDRAEVTSTVWLGSTLNCARCHDHKYDPFSQKDYYKMVAFYNNTAIYPRGPKEVGEEKWFEAELKCPTKDQTSEITKLNQQILGLQTSLKSTSPTDQTAFLAWKASAGAPVTWNTVRPEKVLSKSGESLTTSSDGTVLVGGPVPDGDEFTVGIPATLQPYNSIRLEVLPDPSLKSNGPGRAENGNFVLSQFQLSVGGQPVKASFAKADFTQTDYDPEKSLASDPNGWAINGSEGKPHEMVVDLDRSVSANVSASLRLSCESPYAQHIIGKFRISTTSHPDATVSLISPDLRAIAAFPNPTSADLDRLKAYWHGNDKSLAATRMTLVQAQGKLNLVNSAIPTAMVMQEKPTSKPLAEWVRHRGEFTGKTDLVEAGTPTVLNPLPAGKHDRLALAKWLVSRQNPLTARVQVNRMWELLFGRGLVETSEDFGTRGSPPTHPQLLDYLACHFMNSGWNLKVLYREIVTSSTYRQTSDGTPALMAKDPQNLLLARGARFRMEAEMIHDVALDASGLLSQKIGGPSVFPYQPDHIWDSPYSGEQWMSSKGGDSFRRGIYTFWKRTAPYPSFVALDGTSRESCTVRRIRTNTPLQALALLNDQLMVTASENLGKRMESTGTTLDQHLAAGFELCTCRAPKPAELKRLEGLETVLEKRYIAEPKSAAMLGGKPRDAAFTMVGNVLLNLDETITKD